MSECFSSDYLPRLFDLLKTNSRPPLLSLALARNSTGSCPSAEMRKRRSSLIPWRSPTWERSHFMSNNASQRAVLLKARSYISASATEAELPADASWSFTFSTSGHWTDVSSHLRFDKSVFGSFMKPRWGMSPVYSCDKRRPKRPRLSPEKSGVPIWIMCLTNVNIWKK